MQNKVYLSYTDHQSHSCRADKNPYRHDGRADKDTYRYDCRAYSLSLKKCIVQIKVGGVHIYGLW